MTGSIHAWDRFRRTTEVGNGADRPHGSAAPVFAERNYSRLGWCRGVSSYRAAMCSITDSRNVVASSLFNPYQMLRRPIPLNTLRGLPRAVGIRKHRSASPINVASVAVKYAGRCRGSSGLATEWRCTVAPKYQPVTRNSRDFGATAQETIDTPPIVSSAGLPPSF